MAGSKKATFRGKGGFLNDSDGVIKGYQITTEPPFDNPGGYFYNTLTVQEDGKDEPTDQSLFMGGTADDFTVSKDGHQLSPDDDKSAIGGGTANADFIASFEAAMDVAGADGGAQADLGDDSNVIDYTPIIGARVRFAQQPLSETELADLKRRGKATVRKAANGKTYPLTKTVVAKFYGFEKVATGKSNTVAKGGKPNGAAIDIATLGQEAVVAVLGEAKNQTLKLSALSTKVLQLMMAGPNKAHKNEVASFVSDEDNIGAMTGVAYNAKTETVSLEA